MPHSSTKPSGSKDKRSPEGSTKTLTPQRKHRKLLKDGTSEVWPESIEQIFVEGLRQYWESPWATYSRGRSRWRNQFLVDYLQKAGVERTKKQVASHIQVLRNMWRDEPEFHLVAGGDELSLDTGFLPPVKAEDRPEHRGLLAMDQDDDAFSPISPSTPGYSPLSDNVYGRQLSPQSPIDSPGGSVIQPSLYSSGPLSSPGGLGVSLTAFGAKKRYSNGSSFASSSPVLSSSPSIAFRSDMQIPKPVPVPPQPTDQARESTHEPNSPPSSASSFGRASSQPQSTTTNYVRSFNPPSSPILGSNYSSAPSLWGNRLCYLSLWAEGMHPFTIPASAAPSIQLPSPVTLRIKLRLPSIDDVRSPPTLHGFHGTMTLATPWLSAAECITKVYVNNVCIAQESGALHPLELPGISVGPSTVQVFLPESPLSRSRWLDATTQTMITQQIVVDGATLALVIYDLDRQDDIGNPSAEVLSIQSLAEALAPATPMPLISSTYRYGSNYGQSSSHTPFIPPRSRGLEQTSLSCALTPVNNTFAVPPAMTTSLLY